MSTRAEQIALAQVYATCAIAAEGSVGYSPDGFLDEVTRIITELDYHSVTHEGVTYLFQGTEGEYQYAWERALQEEIKKFARHEIVGPYGVQQKAQEEARRGAVAHLVATGKLVQA